MAWLRKGDNAATHPLVMALSVVRGADDRLLNEAYGFLQRCAEQSAGHTTDGVIDQGTAILVGGPTRWQALVDACVEAGLLTRQGRGRAASWKIIEDADFLHIRSRAELEWERRRRRDSANPDLVVPVRRRDGDGCRYCGVIVQWRARRGLRRGTYHHREGRHTNVTTAIMFVVACHGCNLLLGDTGLAAESEHPIMPPPRDPFYGPDTVELLANHGVVVAPSDPSRVAEPATPARPGASRTTVHASAIPTGSRTAVRVDDATDSAPDLQIPAGSADPGSPARDGTGRVGTGRDGTRLVGAGADPPQAGQRRRGRRGRRGGGSGG